MSKKREATDDAVDENVAKRTQLNSTCQTNIMDLPNEMLFIILADAVYMEVLALKLAKTAWKAAAQRMWTRLGCTCQRWSNIVTDYLFQQKVYKMLDATAEKPLHFELLFSSSVFEHDLIQVVPLKELLFMLHKPKHQEAFINVYRRDTIAVIGVIPLLGIYPLDMVACNVSNCLYMLSLESHCRAVWRVTWSANNVFEIRPWILSLGLSFTKMSLYSSLRGHLMILSEKNGPNPSVISIYGPNSLLKHEILAYPDKLNFNSIIGLTLKRNGNVVLASVCQANRYLTEIKELDPKGVLIRQYTSSINAWGGITSDIYDRIVIQGQQTHVEVIDSEFNLLVKTKSRDYTQMYSSRGVHFNGERKESCILFENTGYMGCVTLMIFRFTE